MSYQYPGLLKARFRLPLMIANFLNLKILKLLFMKMSLRKTLLQLSQQQDQLPQKIIRYVLPVVFVIFVMPALAQNSILVKGRVNNENSQPIQGASVLVKGTSTGATSDENGNFEIKLLPTGRLLFLLLVIPHLK